MKTWEQTAKDMDERFRGGFQAAGGNSQSLTFMLHAATKLPESFNLLRESTYDASTNIIEGYEATIADYGCALGDGSAILQAVFPLSDVIGYDISPVAVELAKERWPHIKFEVGDILKPKAHDIAFASHVIEHLQYPHKVIQGLLELHKVVVVIVPFVTDTKYETHEGAMHTADWLSELPEPAFECAYNTLRADLESDNKAICEGNHLYMWVK